MSSVAGKVTDFLRHHGLAVAVAVALLVGIGWKMRDPWASTQKIDNEPRQGELIANPASWPHEGAVLTEVATWDLDAVILHREWYRFDHFGAVAPLDLALGWGPMSDREVLSELKIQQRNRWYWVYWPGPMAHAEEELMASSSNVHILPATPAVLHDLRSLRQGDNVRLSGRLVDVSYGNQLMRTSRTRADRGGGACEVFFVQSAERF
jgi:hypothetical protein